MLLNWWNRHFARRAEHEALLQAMQNVIDSQAKVIEALRLATSGDLRERVIFPQSNRVLSFSRI